MKIKTAELLTALEAVHPGLANKELIEQSTAFVFTEGRVYTFNDQVAVSHAVPKGLKGAVQGKQLHAFLKRCADAELDVDTTENEFKMVGKRSKAGIPLQAEITMPLDEIRGERSWRPLPANFADAVGFTLFSAGADITKPELTGVHLTPAHAETCDNFRMTRCAFDGKARINLLVPAAACADLVKYAPTKFSADDAWAHFVNAAGAEFSCRLIAADFPDLDQFIGKRAKYRLQFHEGVGELLDRAQVFVDDDAGALQHVRVVLTENKMVVTAQGSGGWFEERIKCAYTGDALEFLVNPKFLRSMLAELRDVSIDADKRLLKFDGKGFVHCCALIEPEAGKIRA